MRRQRNPPYHDPVAAHLLTVSGLDLTVLLQDTLETRILLDRANELFAGHFTLFRGNRCGFAGEINSDVRYPR